jgi:hypothetical protein
MIRLVGTTCCESALLEQLVASLLASSTLLQDDNNLFQTTSCEIFTRVNNNVLFYLLTLYFTTARSRQAVKYAKRWDSSRAHQQRMLYIQYISFILPPPPSSQNVLCHWSCINYCINNFLHQPTLDADIFDASARLY